MSDTTFVPSRHRVIHAPKRDAALIALGDLAKSAEQVAAEIGATVAYVRRVRQHITGDKSKTRCPYGPEWWDENDDRFKKHVAKLGHPSTW